MDFISFFVVVVLMILSYQYNYDIFSAGIILVYSIFAPSKSNFLFVLLFAVLIFIKDGTINVFWILVLLVLFAVIFIRSLFKNKKSNSNANYEDLAKLLGGGGY
ncbi:MAG: hypothetical protein PHU47_00195 [Candidatus ainarchaeum sp.]|jgi:Ca2+/Na+ antiporter|nr:hypothetical protein [Candidatus ainarchaeum sp.]